MDSKIENFGLSQMEGLPLLATVVYDAGESNEKAWLRMQVPVTKFLRETISERDQLWIAAFDSKLRFKTHRCAIPASAERRSLLCSWS